MTLLITACSKDKCGTLETSASSLGTGTADELAREWINRLSATEDRMVAESRYRGRGHRYASAAARRYGVSHLIMSAGLGLVRPSDEIPAYSLTLKSGEEDSILPHLLPPAGPSHWWQAIERHSPWARSLADEWDQRGIVLIALPLDYFEILPVLAQLPRSVKPRLRVISGAAGSSLPEELRACLLPYDARFNGPDSPERGTGSDFLGRAVRHFLALLETSGDGDIDCHRALVEGALRSMRPASRRPGRRLPDEEISKIIRSELRAGACGSSKILRRFRDELGIACEQGRLQRLYADVVAERAA